MSTGTTDTYGSAFDYPENGNGGGGGAAFDGRGGEAAGGDDGSNSKVVDDFKDGVEMLTEKRCAKVPCLVSFGKVCRKCASRAHKQQKRRTSLDLCPRMRFTFLIQHR